MASITLHISIPKDLSEFLEKNPDLSPSKMFQAKCYEIMVQRKDFEQIIRAKDNIIRNLMNFITSKQLNQEFQEWKNK